MKMAVRAVLGALATLALASPSFAATVAPTSYPFTLKGGGNLNQPSIIWPCGWTFQMQTSAPTGGTMTGGVGDTNPGCDGFTVAPTTWSATSATTGVFHGLNFQRPASGFYCWTPADVPFTFLKSGNNVTSFFFNGVYFGSNCYFNANLNTGAALTVVP
jgi:hypothetical protein